MLFFVLPVKVKWLALLTWLFYGYSLVTGSWAERLLVLAAVANFLLFFGKDIYARARYGHRKLRQHSVTIAARDTPRHTCTVCGITDKTDRTMDFRYCTQCEPPVAYCSEHLRTHTHRHAESVH
jgi:ribosomal protein L37AE/L43A